VLGTVAEPPAGTGAGLTRWGLLVTVAGASGLLTLTTVGETFHPLRKLSLLAPRDPDLGPQGHPVNRSAANAGVVDLARSPAYRLEVVGRVARPVSLTLGQLQGLPTHSAVLPIACVEGWSYSAGWSGVRIRDLLAMAGADTGRTVLVESLEPNGAYRTSTLDPAQVADRDTLLATQLDGQPLAIDHGFPCRLIAPNRPGVLQTKWVTKVTVL
jgi:DMSO/TMAO reductase YedYZ molybdopterin-dependent catalytic subunit